MRLRILKFAAVIVASVLALGALAYAYFIYSPSIPPHLSGQASNLVVDVDGKPRSYIAYVPAQLPKGGPLLVVLHGTVMTGAMMRQWTGYEFDVLADKEHFAVVYPDGIGRSWDDCLRGGDAEKKQNAGSRGGKPYIVLYSVLNGGHVVPQPSFRFPRLLGATTLDQDIPLEANALFKL